MIDVMRDLVCPRWMLLGACVVGLCACSSSEDPAPSEVSLELVDAETLSPVAGAQVTSSAGASQTQYSDEAGQLKLEFEGELDVVAAGYLPLGLRLAGDVSSGPGSVTLPLTASGPRQRTVRGEIAGWDELPEMPEGKYRMARVEAAQLNDVSRIQRWLSLQTTGALCVTRGTAAPCAFELNVQQAARAVFAVVVEGDDAGTPEDFSDDQLEGVGFGLLPIAPGDQLLADQVLQLLADDDQFSVSVRPGAGGGSVAAEPVGVPGVSLGDQVLVFPPFSGVLSGYRVPKSSVKVGDLGLEGSTLWGISVSVEQDGSGIVVSRGAELGPETGGQRTLDVGDALAPVELEETASGYRVGAPQGSFVLAERDGAQSLALGAHSFQAPKIAAWIQICEAPAAPPGDFSQGLAKAERCSARKLQP